MKKIQWFWFDHRTDVPRWLAAGIGQIAIEWSVLERELEELIRLLMDVEINVGRMSTTGMNARTRILVATNFTQSHVRNNNLPCHFLTNFIKLGERITDKLEGERNKLVHGLWDRKRGTRRWHVLRTTGARRIPELTPEIKKLSRTVLPQGEEMTREKLEDIARRIAQASDEIVAICVKLKAALPPSQNKYPQYTRRHHQPRVRSRKASPARRRSSRGSK